MEKVIILAIETSCDETAVSVVREDKGAISVLAETVASQVNIHKLTGGVVPEVAAREHVAVLQPMIKKVIEESGVEPAKLSAIAVTVGPGLAPALATGVTAARTLAYAWKKPIVPVHHIEGHIYSALLASASNAQFSIFNFQFSNDDVFPVLALVVSGGHTLLVRMKDFVQYEVLGSTRDDAAGEAFDKVARLLDLGYPGGPAISRLAESGDPRAFNFARPMLRSGDLDFSFSGLKTEVLYTVRGMEKTAVDKQRANLAASFQQAAVDSLVGKAEQAVKAVEPKILVLAGGVAANDLLRAEMQEMAGRNRLELRIAPVDLCGDNAVMIGLAAVLAWQKGRQTDWREVDFNSRAELEKFSILA